MDVIHVYTNRQLDLLNQVTGRTSPEPVLKNLFLVPECDFSLSSVGDVVANPLASAIRRDVEPRLTGLKNRVRSDIVESAVGV